MRNLTLRRSLRRSVLAIVGGVVVCTAVAVPAASSASAPRLGGSSATTAPAIWFLSDTFTLQLRTTTGAIQDLSGSGSLAAPQWSPTRQLLAYSSFVATGEQMVSTVAPDGTHGDSFTCTCAGTPVWVDHANRLAVLHNHSLVVRDPIAQTTTTVKLKGKAHFSNGSDVNPDPAAVAAVRHGLVFAAATGAGASAYGGPETLFRTSLSGHVTKLRPAGGNVAINEAVVSSNGKQLAYLIGEHGGACSDYFDVGVLNPVTGALTRVKLPKLNRPWAPTSLRYRGNHLYVALASAPPKCGSGTTTKPASTTPTLYRVHGRKLVRPMKGIIDQDISAGWTATRGGSVKIDPESGASPTPLVIAKGKTSVTVAPKVFTFGWL